MIAELAELYRRRTLIDHMARGQLRASVHRTLLGTAWYLLIPAIQIGIYYLLVVVIFQRGSGGGYFLMLSMGILHYSVFSQSLSNSMGSIHGNSSMLLQIKIEPLVLVAASFVRSLKTSLVGVAIFLLLYAALGPSFSLRIVAYPLILLLWLCFCWSAAVLVSALAVFSRDLEKFLPFLTQIMMYMSPVIYSVTFFPETLYDIFVLNPITAIFALLQWSLLDAPLPPVHGLVLLPITLTALFLGSYYFYVWGRKRFTKLF